MQTLTLQKLCELFPDDAAAEHWFARNRWGEAGPHCPHCDSYNVQRGASHPTMPYRSGTVRAASAFPSRPAPLWRPPTSATGSWPWRSTSCPRAPRGSERPARQGSRHQSEVGLVPAAANPPGLRGRSGGVPRGARRGGRNLRGRAPSHKGVGDQDLEARDWEYITEDDAAKSFLTNGLQDELPEVLNDAFDKLEI